ncbi:hypothetical protein V6N12_042769, partial [Hibiscus sabdariffa]
DLAEPDVYPWDLYQLQECGKEANSLDESIPHLDLDH